MPRKKSADFMRSRCTSLGPHTAFETRWESCCSRRWCSAAAAALLDGETKRSWRTTRLEGGGHTTQRLPANYNTFFVFFFRRCFLKWGGWGSGGSHGSSRVPWSWRNFSHRWRGSKGPEKNRNAVVVQELLGNSALDTPQTVVTCVHILQKQIDAK